MLWLWLLLGILGWWLCGSAGFIYWWTKDYDFTIDELFVSFAVGLAGPFTWLIGRAIHRPDSPLIKKRN